MVVGSQLRVYMCSKYILSSDTVGLAFPLFSTRFPSHPPNVCVCVYVIEREREREIDKLEREKRERDFFICIHTYCNL